jgi:hypothetical protein
MNLEKEAGDDLISPSWFSGLQIISGCLFLLSRVPD